MPAEGPPTRSSTWREAVPALAGCGCLGGFLASSLGAYAGTFPGMEPAGAAIAVGLCLLALRRGWVSP